MEWNINGLIHDNYEAFARRGPQDNDGHARYEINCAIMVLYGVPGSGKTRAVLEYCKRNPASLYFGFRGLTSEMALKRFTKQYPRVFETSCTDWQTFFAQLHLYARKKRPVILFDDPGERNDKPDFYESLQAFGNQMLQERLAMVVLTAEPWDKFPLHYFSEHVPCVTPSELARMLPKWTVEDVFRLFSVTDGIYALTQEAKGYGSFTEYLAGVCQNESHSVFLRLAPCWLEKAFRSPEAYNTLLYGMAGGKNRITELSAFSGYPKNKCEKYLGALIDAGLVRKEKEDGKRPDYYLDLSYLHAWYRYVFLSMGRMDKIPERIANYAEKTAVPDKLHKEVVRWMPQRMWILYHTEMLDTRPNCENIMVQGMRFDYVEKTSNETIFAIAKIQFADSDWDAIERAIESVTPFYEAKIILCSIHQFSRFYWKLNRTYENIRLIQLKSMD